MGSPILELDNSANWSNVYHVNLVAQSAESGERYYPIPQLTVPITFDKHIIAVYPTSQTAKSWWISAGWLEQKIFTGILVGGSPDVRAQESQRLLLNRINLTIFPKLTSTYQLNIDIPYWFQDYDVEIWEYSGNEYDSTELLVESNETLLLEIKALLDEVNSKL